YMHSLKGQYVDFDKMYAMQCMDLVVDYAYNVTNKFRLWGNAKDLTWVALPKGWKLVKNTHDYIPPIASIAVYTTGIYK
ncbi:N-acetylmuramoyl-L-alanine amidase, partial [Staphylococcus warneri]